MTEKVALVSGASRGVGRAVAVGLAREGFKIVAMARKMSALSTIAEEASVPRERVFPLAFDLSEIDSIAAAVRSIPKNFGALEVVVNNAGEGCVGTLDVSPEKFRSLLTVNLVAPFILLREVTPLLIEGGKGLIVNIASRAGKIGFAGWGAYAASKFGLVGLGESLYRELASKGIRVTTLCPGWIDTDMAKEGGSPLKSNEMIQPEDIMRTIRWLLSLSPAVCVREVVMECQSAIE